jgi:hypothetical protein
LSNDSSCIEDINPNEDLHTLASFDVTAIQAGFNSYTLPARIKVDAGYLIYVEISDNNTYLTASPMTTASDYYYDLSLGKFQPFGLGNGNFMVKGDYLLNIGSQYFQTAFSSDGLYTIKAGLSQSTSNALAYVNIYNSKVIQPFHLSLPPYLHTSDSFFFDK